MTNTKAQVRLLEEFFKKISSLRKEIFQMISIPNFSDLNDYHFAQVISFYQEEYQKSEKTETIQKLLLQPAGNLNDQEKDVCEKITRENLYCVHFLKSYENDKLKNDLTNFHKKYEELNNRFFEEEHFNYKDRLKNFEPSILAPEFSESKKISNGPVLNNNRLVKDVENKKQDNEKRETSIKNYLEINRSPKTNQVNGNESSQPILHPHRIHSKGRSSGVNKETSKYEGQDESLNFNLPPDMKIQKISEFGGENFSQENLQNEFLAGNDKNSSKSRTGFRNTMKKLVQKTSTKETIDYEAKKSKIEALFQENAALSHEIAVLQSEKEIMEKKIKDLALIQSRQSGYKIGSYGLNSPQSYNDFQMNFNENISQRENSVRYMKKRITRLENEINNIQIGNIQNNLDSASKFGNRMSLLTEGNFKNEEGKKSLEPNYRSTKKNHVGVATNLFVDRIYTDINRALNFSSKKFVKQKFY